MIISGMLECGDVLTSLEPKSQAIEINQSEFLPVL
jgi:hypothetical protein